MLGDEVSFFILIRRLLLTGVASGGNSSKLSRDGLFLVGVGSEWICLVGVGTEYVLSRNFGAKVTLCLIFVFAKMSYAQIFMVSCSFFSKEKLVT